MPIASIAPLRGFAALAFAVRLGAFAQSSPKANVVCDGFWSH